MATMADLVICQCRQCCGRARCKYNLGRFSGATSFTARRRHDHRHGIEQTNIKTEGEGPAILLLHGFGAAIDWWDEIVSTLAAKHRVISAA
jgi:pimeloyl-ACP methyl ester carboxylesterase